ncbi:hypothetical protein UFOVP891_20 [uncultured Caudovirales phage]|uniref:Uncharacterized protein n=1 Tax=uncultured Caudovirales phage TaxID=2100421 RepID=A0A6J5MEV8_9CAUD|nr:hypothetical protein UFOVP472_48 [uncultured Caudovirales phage]CAB4169008.1 hypothetical protein UFOVP891_20 [uncultured Caudovirales phage]CAB4180788.1 hypothetical protein UFOVP1053_48 [uncultured Caudovirales phage]CAB4195641.1 hypothetical protein UFOVP1297_26 [uncultured Caudovirales phage]CAB4221868.1 hypothetical protein UFOVP1647_4 [uncultured Caudovirales phage]
MEIPKATAADRDYMRQRAGESYFCRVVSKTHAALIEIPKARQGKVRGLTAAEHHGKTFFIGGAHE